MGFYAGKGKHLFNDNTIDDFIETDTSFMENKLTKILNEDVGLLYTNNHQIKWFKRKVNTLYFGSITEQIIPFKRYDSIFFIKEEKIEVEKIFPSKRLKIILCYNKKSTTLKI